MTSVITNPSILSFISQVVNQGTQLAHREQHQQEQAGLVGQGGRQHFRSRSPRLQILGQGQQCILWSEYVHQEGRSHTDQELFPWHPERVELDQQFRPFRPYLRLTLLKASLSLLIFNPILVTIRLRWKIFYRVGFSLGSSCTGRDEGDEKDELKIFEICFKACFFLFTFHLVHDVVGWQFVVNC